jgi:hypothetical protein
MQILMLRETRCVNRRRELAQSGRYVAGERLTSAVLDGFDIAVDEVFPV